jgi:DNA-binding transcriptional ArsR family regulator
LKPVKKLLWWLLAGTSGGTNRGKIVEKIVNGPMNANELADVLNLDYKTVRHHLTVLQKNRLLTTMGTGYGTMYFPSNLLEENIEHFNEIWEQIGKNKINKKRDKRGKNE